MKEFGWKRNNVDYENVTRIGIYGIVRNAQQDVLVLKTTRPTGIEYVLPGGGTKPLESHEDTMKRELLEEVGYDCSLGTFIVETIDYYFSPAEHRPKLGIAYFYHVHLKDKTNEIHEQDNEICWLTLNECRHKIKRDYQLYAIEEAFKSLE